MQHTRFFPIALLLLVTLSACADDPTPTTPTPDPLIFSLVVPRTLSMAVGDSTQVRAIATLLDNTTQVITTEATWQSLDTSIATVSASGVLTAVAAGSTDVTLAFKDRTTGLTLTVSPTTAPPTTYWGVTAGINSVVGTVTMAITGGTRVDGMLYLGRNAISLLGRFDAPTNVVNVTGGGFTFTGTVANKVVSGTFTEASGTIGGFSTLDATRTAVTSYCGAYTSGGTTSLDNADAGAFVLSVALDGTVVGASLPSDATSAPLIFNGKRTGESLALTTSLGGTGNGQIQSSTTSGSFTTAIGSSASFTATPGACQ